MVSGWSVIIRYISSLKKGVKQGEAIGNGVLWGGGGGGGGEGEEGGDENKICQSFRRDQKGRVYCMIEHIV